MKPPIDVLARKKRRRGIWKLEKGAGEAFVVGEQAEDVREVRRSHSSRKQSPTAPRRRKRV